MLKSSYLKIIKILFGLAILLVLPTQVSAEALLENTYGDCDVQASDSDNDGILDMYDNCPLISNPTQMDSDSDGYGDACDICPGGYDGQDIDNDGQPDDCDICPGGDDGQDSDGDGIPNACDHCPYSRHNICDFRY